MRKVGLIFLLLIIFTTIVCSCRGGVPSISMGRPAITSDNAGGAFVLYKNININEGRGDFYLQKLNSKGNPLWGKNGLLIGSGFKSSDDFSAVSDGKGGVITTWSADPLYVAKVTSTGTTSWKNTITGYHVPFADNKGGAFITSDIGSRNNLNVAKINSEGNIVWEKQENVMSAVAGDNSGGLFMVQSAAENKVEVQRMDSEGNITWKNSLSTSLTEEPRMASDDSGNLFMVWHSGSNIYIQKLDSKGNSLWQSDGLIVYTSRQLPPYNPSVAADNEGGAYISFFNESNQLQIQKVNTNGELTWIQSLESKLISSGFYSITSDGGVIIDWIGSGEEIVQKIDAGGNRLWGEKGVPVISGSEMRSASTIVNNDTPSLISGDGNGGVLITWTSGSDSYIQRIDSQGKRMFGEQGMKLN